MRRSCSASIDAESARARTSAACAASAAVLVVLLPTLYFTFGRAAWIALAIGLVMLAVWIFLLTRLGRIPVAPRQHRLDLAQMSTSEKRWTLALIAFGAGLIALLNGAATVDWAPLAAAVGSGKVGSILFALGLAVYLIVMMAGIWISWRRSRTAFIERKRHSL